LANFTFLTVDFEEAVLSLCFTLGVSWPQANNETDNSAVKIIFDFILMVN
jgi:hypothetical protein